MENKHTVLRWVGFMALWFVSLLICLRWAGHLTVRYTPSNAVERVNRYTTEKSKDFHEWLDEKADQIVKKK